MRERKTVQAPKPAPKVLPRTESLEEKAGKASVKGNERTVIEALIGELKFSDKYKRIEKDLKKLSEDEKEALDLGFKPDNYYTAKGKKDVDADIAEEEEHSGSFGHRTTRS